MKRSSKRKLNGLKLRRLNLSVHPEVFEQFEKIAGPVSYNVTFEEITKFASAHLARRANKQKTPSVAENAS